MVDEHGLGRKLDPETPRARALHPAEAGETDRTVRHWAQREAWLDQGATGQCVGFSFAHRRADGPVKVEGIDYDFASALYLDASALYYGSPDTSLQNGTSALSACQVLQSRGAIDRYTWITDPLNLRYTLLEVGSVLVGTNWYSSMDWPRETDDGSQVYLKITYSTTLRGGHEYLINGIDLDPADGTEPYYR